MTVQKVLEASKKNKEELWDVNIIISAAARLRDFELEFEVYD